MLEQMQHPTEPRLGPHQNRIPVVAECGQYHMRLREHFKCLRQHGQRTGLRPEVVCHWPKWVGDHWQLLFIFDDTSLLAARLQWWPAGISRLELFSGGVLLQELESIPAECATTADAGLAQAVVASEAWVLQLAEHLWPQE